MHPDNIGTQFGPLFHGTKATFHEGDTILPPSVSGAKQTDYQMNGNSVAYASTDAADAKFFGSRHKGFGKVTVYKVAPIGIHGVDDVSDQVGGSDKTFHVSSPRGFKVLGVHEEPKDTFSEKPWLNGFSN